MREGVHQKKSCYLLLFASIPFVIIHHYYSTPIEPSKLDLFPLSTTPLRREAHKGKTPFFAHRTNFRPKRVEIRFNVEKRHASPLTSFNQNNTKPVCRRRHRLRVMEKLSFQFFTLLFQTCPNLFCTYETTVFAVFG